MTQPAGNNENREHKAVSVIILPFHYKQLSPPSWDAHAAYMPCFLGMAAHSHGFKGRILKAGKKQWVTNKEKKATYSQKPSAHCLAILSANGVRTACLYSASVAQEQWWGLGKKK